MLMPRGASLCGTPMALLPLFVFCIIFEGFTRQVASHAESCGGRAAVCMIVHHFNDQHVSSSSIGVKRSIWCVFATGFV